MARQSSIRFPRQQQPQGGGGGGAPTQERNMSITMMPEQNQQQEYEDDDLRERIENLTDKFHEIKSRNRKGKVATLDVIDDGRISVPERLALFVEAAAKKGINKQQALEFAVKRLESKGDDIAGDGSRSRRTVKNEDITISRLLDD